MALRRRRWRWIVSMMKATRKIPEMTPANAITAEKSEWCIHEKVG